MIARLPLLAFALSSAFLLAACRSHCPTIGPVGSEKPTPLNPIASAYQSAKPPSAITTSEIELWDADRNRRVPSRVFIPVAGNHLPVIIFSHGLGSSRAGYQYLGHAWAAAGYIAVHVEHTGSNRGLSLWRLYKASYDPDVWKNRPRDIGFVLDSLERKDPLLQPVWQRADLARVGVAGHSYGAQTVLNLAGALTTFSDAEKNLTCVDDRIAAVAALSAPWMPASPDPSSFEPVRVPILHMTGTADKSPAFETELCHKRVPFEWISGPPQYLVTMEGAVHRSFAGEQEAGGPDIERHHQMIVEFTTAFWDAFLRDDPGARQWLENVAPARAAVERK